MGTNRTIAITGASGHLGTILTLEALARGDTVRAGCSGYQPDIEHENLTWVKAGLTPDALDSFVEGADAVVHSAAIISVAGGTDDRLMKTNVDGTRYVLDACEKHGVKRMIHISSATVAEDLPWSIPYDEARKLKEASTATPYEHSKMLSEEIVRERVTAGSIEAIIIRPSGLIGPPDLRGAAVCKVLYELYFGKMAFVMTGGYNFVDARDVADGILSAIDRGVNGETYLLTGKHYSLKAVAEMMNELGGGKIPIAIPVNIMIALVPLIRLITKLKGNSDVITKESLAMFRDSHPQMSYEKAKQDLNYEPRALKESLLDMIAWWKKSEKA